MFTRSSSFFSSSWERKALAAFFHKWGEANPLGGGPGGARDGKIAPQACTCHANLLGTIGPRRGAHLPRWGRAQGRMPGQCSEGGTPPRLDPKTNPKLASVAWESGGWSLSLPAACTGGSRTTWRGGAGGMILQQPPISPLHRASCWAGTYSDPQFKSRTIPLGGFVGATIGLGTPLWAGLLPQTLRRPMEDFGPGGWEGGRAGRGQAIPSLQLCPRSPISFRGVGGLHPPFTWGRQAINAGSQLVRSKCGWSVSKGLSATQTLNF